MEKQREKPKKKKSTKPRWEPKCVKISETNPSKQIMRFFFMRYIHTLPNPGISIWKMCCVGSTLLKPSIYLYNCVWLLLLSHFFFLLLLSFRCMYSASKSICHGCSLYIGIYNANSSVVCICLHIVELATSEPVFLVRSIIE